MSVRHRLLLVLVAAAAVGGVLAAAGGIALVRAAVRERYFERLRAETALLAEWVEHAPAPVPQDLAVRAAAKLGVRITLIDAAGVVIGESAIDERRLAELDNHSDRPEIRAARLGRTGESLRSSRTTNVEYLYSARSLDGPGPIRYVRIAMPSTEVDRAWVAHGWIVIPLLFTALGVLIVPTYVAVRSLSRPMERIADEIERATLGETRLALPQGGGQEVERVSRAVVRMQSALLQQIGELDAERSVFASVIAGMREGLIVVGADRRVRLVNDALLRALELDFDPRGHRLEEAVRHPTVLHDVAAALEGGREVSGSSIRLPGSGRSFQLQVTPLRGEPGAPPKAALALLFDITKLERLEAVRREFVANVSHELRTPLTAIAAAVETLLDGASEHPDDARRFLEIVRKHADRMGDLIEDLTDLSLIETGAVALNRHELDVAEVVRGVVEHLMPLATARGVQVRVDMPAPLVVSADRRRLEQVLTNLIDNAIKFNKTNGNVTIRAGRGSKGPTLVVEDTGIGIPAESLDKVFHRFHQVSRDRSRELRGTGLGLAIVKHLMRLHGGTVSVESELGVGSRFSLEFPDAA